MKDMKMTQLIAKGFNDYDEGHVGAVLYDLGFRTVNDVLEMRVYDLLNVNRMSRNRVESIIYSLYRFLNWNLEVDEAVEFGLMKQPLD